MLYAHVLCAFFSTRTPISPLLTRHHQTPPGAAWQAGIASGPVLSWAISTSGSADRQIARIRCLPRSVENGRLAKRLSDTVPRWHARVVALALSKCHVSGSCALLTRANGC